MVLADGCNVDIVFLALLHHTLTEEQAANPYTLRRITMSFSLVSQLIVIVVLVCCSADAFIAQTSSSRQSTQVAATTQSRRNMLGALVAGAAALATCSQPAQATYSAYTNREKDWETRNKEGNVNYSSAKSLRSQLREIAPMNSEGSKVFCPNGPSANVSPLMENKCSDALAMPSVYGRTQDTVGNSVPGFAGGRYPSNMVGNGSGSINDLGGFPAYQRDVRNK